MNNSSRKNKLLSACLNIIIGVVVYVCVFEVPDIYESWLRDQRDEYIRSAAFKEAHAIAKKASLETFGVTRVQNEEVYHFFYARMAVLFGPHAPVAGYGPHFLQETKFEEGSITLGSGVATAVSPDGYFLTAAHCLLDEAGNRIDPLWVLGLTTANPYLAQADVIWISEDHDLALIHARIKQAKWSTVAETSPEIGSTVIAGGYVTGHGAGKLLSRTEESSETPRCIRLKHNIRQTKGDSGGPLVDMNGHLVGIHCNSSYTPLSIFRKPRQRWAHSHFVTEDWLQRLIQDHRNQMNSEEQQPAEQGGAGQPATRSESR